MGRSMFPFGSGRMFLQPTGLLSFMRIGVAAMQEGGWSLDVDVKELHGANRWPVDVRTGMGKIEGTAKFTDWDADTMAAMLGASVTPNFAHLLSVAVDSAIASTINVQTALTALSGTFIKNLEVVKLSTGLPMTQVASAPSTGQYSVVNSTGVYSFNATDVTAAFNVRLNYIWSKAAGKQIAFNNVAIGTTPVMAGIFQGISDAKQMVFELDYVVPHGIKWSQRIDDWSHQDINLKAFANPDTDVIGRISLTT